MTIVSFGSLCVLDDNCRIPVRGQLSAISSERAKGPAVDIANDAGKGSDTEKLAMTRLMK